MIFAHAHIAHGDRHGVTFDIARNFFTFSLFHF